MERGAGLRIRETTEYDERGIRELFALCFGREMSHEEWLWKYRRSPWGSYAVVALDGDRIIAHYGGIKNKFYFKGEYLYAYQFCDVMTHPRYRAYRFSKTPLTAMLNEMFYGKQSMDIAYGFPSLRHARLQCLRLGGEGYRFVQSYKKICTGQSSICRKVRIEEGWRFLEDMDMVKILENDGASVKFIKDKEYLRWRYIDNPVNTYFLLAFKRLFTKKGYIVCAFKDGWLNIMEMFVKDYRDTKDILISLDDYAMRKGAAGIKTWLHPNEQLTKYFESAGYTGENDIPIAFRQVNKRCVIKAEDFFERYYYRMGDYDAG